MIYYIDENFRLHTENDGTMHAWEDTTGFFNNKCRIFIEGYMVIPEGKSWVDLDGNEFIGLMIAPAEPFEPLYNSQLGYEEASETIAELDAALLDVTYQNILGGI